MSVAPLMVIPRPSPWFTWHERYIGPGVRVLDLACGQGRHALAAAARGADVIAIDRDQARLDAGRAVAERERWLIDWRQRDLAADWPDDLGSFDVVLVFDYLDRGHMRDILRCVGPGGLLIMEAFLSAQQDLGWGPSSTDHLLEPLELARLVAPLEIVHAREALEPLEGDRWRAVASIVAERRAGS